MGERVTREEFVTCFHEEQLKLATRIAARLLGTLDGKSRQECWVFAGHAEVGIVKDYDPASDAMVLANDLERDVYHCIKLYAEWLGCKLMHSGDWGKKQTIPECTPEDKEAIVKTDLPDALERKEALLRILDFVLADLRARPTHLPPIGYLVDGEIEADIITFPQWADLYDWSKSSQK